jgi:hypothetical protein
MYKECRHIKISGGKCQAAVLKGQPYCYFHSTQRRRAARPAAEKFFLELPLLEDRSAIQIALSEVAAAIAGGRIDPKRAGLLLYCLQIASQNLKGGDIVADKPVNEMTVTQDGQELAPEKKSYSDEFAEVVGGVLAKRFMNNILPDEDDEDEDEPEDEEEEDGEDDGDNETEDEEEEDDEIDADEEDPDEDDRDEDSPEKQDDELQDGEDENGSSGPDTIRHPPSAIRSVQPSAPFKPSVALSG